jgi:hypothetical protein
MDYPGHYFRRIKSVSLTIPCVTGPYTSVNCTLTLLNSKIRVDNMASSKTDYANDAHFISNFAATQSIATSTGQNDSGLFEVNFGDERYLPFEGAGAISTWQIDLPLDCNTIDPIDMVLLFKVTSRYGGDPLRDIAKQCAILPSRPMQTFTGSTTKFAAPQTALQRMFSLRHEYPTEWYKFLNPPAAATSQSMSIALGNDRYPFQYRGYNIKITQVEFVLMLANPALLGTYVTGGQLVLQVGPPTAGTPATVSLASLNAVLNGAPYGTAALPPAPAPAPASPGAPPSWMLQVNSATVGAMATAFQSPANSSQLNPATIGDILMICDYSAVPA